MVTIAEKKTYSITIVDVNKDKIHADVEEQELRELKKKLDQMFPPPPRELDAEDIADLLSALNDERISDALRIVKRLTGVEHWAAETFVGEARSKLNSGHRMFENNPNMRQMFESLIGDLTVYNEATKSRRTK